MNSTQWQALARQVSEEASIIFHQAGQGRQHSERKEDNSFLTQTDLALQQIISERLQQADASIPVLGEEMSPELQQQLLETGSCWLLDPLDGTSNFTHGIPVYAVSLALLHQGEVVAGMVFDPNRQELFTAVRGQGAWLNDTPLVRNLAEGPAQLGHAMAVIDTKRLPDVLAQAIATAHPYHSQRSFGSVALDWCWLAAGRIQTYVHGKQKLWDYSAGALIAREAGVLTQTLQGEDILHPPLTLTPRSAVGACPALAGLWPSWLAQHQV